MASSIDENFIYLATGVTLNPRKPTAAKVGAFVFGTTLKNMPSVF